MIDAQFGMNDNAKIDGIAPLASRLLLTLLTLAWLSTGCATSDSNPTRPRAKTGYVDLRADAPDAFCWDVWLYDERAKSFKRHYSEYSAPPSGVLRLGFAPGPHRIRISFLNRAVFQPAEIEVDVADGQVTPVVVTLTDAGDTTVVSKQETLGGTSGNLSGRRTKVQTGQSDFYRLTAVASAPLAYAVKAQMPYTK